MSGHDPFDALSLTDPSPKNDPARDDAMLARIVATSLSPEHRHLSRNRRVAIAVAAPLVLAGAGFTYVEVTKTDVNDAGLRPLVLEARREVPLPPGAQWSRLPAELLGPDTSTNGPEMAQDIVLGEAQCHWERYWVDSVGNPSSLATAERGYAQIVERMRGKPWMSELLPWAEKAGAQARSGDTSLFRQNLSVNCPPAMGGSATTVSYVEWSLRESSRPAVALLLARSDPGTLPGDAEQGRFVALMNRIERALADAGTDPEPDPGTTAALGRDFLTVHFSVSDLAKAVPVVQRLAAQEEPLPGSFLIVWDGAKMTRIPIS